MKKAVFMVADWAMPQVYPEFICEQLQELYEFKEFIYPADANPADYVEELKDISAIFSSWGSAKYSKELLDYMPNLEVIYYGAGTMKTILTGEVWKREICVTTANSVNAMPVAEYTLSQILFSLKNGWLNVRKYRQNRNFDFGKQLSLGAYRQTVGIISLSQIGRRVIELLKPFDVEIVFYDPYATAEEGASLGAKKVSLEELFDVSQVVSLHSPLLPKTEGMITGDLLQKISDYGTFINTARGAIVKEDEMLEVLQKRPDLTAVLDVTDPEPVEKNSPLYEMDNVVLSPHIAGSLGTEISRMGQAMVEEAKRFQNNKKMKYELTEKSYRTMA